MNGVQYFQNFITEVEESNLLSEIDSHEWCTDLKRRTQHYGYKYDYTKKKIDKSMYVGTIPTWIKFYCNKLINLGFDKTPDQVIINEYLPGQGIFKHVDCVDCFGDVIASLSLGSNCVMNFEHIKSNKRCNIGLERCSLLILDKESRYDWMHSIPARLEDIVNNVSIKRERRISLTFRTIK